MHLLHRAAANFQLQICRYPRRVCNFFTVREKSRESLNDSADAAKHTHMSSALSLLFAFWSLPIDVDDRKIHIELQNIFAKM
jgi:hypothetical protein